MSKTQPGRIRIGIGGWTFAPWRGTFYPDKLPQKQELEYASRHLTSIEINGTYYGAQKPESFIRWYDETPDDFLFSVKAPRFATNRRVLAEAGETIDRFFNGGVLRLQSKLGPINWQFMATKKFDPVDFESFLKILPSSIDGRTLRHVVEVRHESFCTSEFTALVSAYGVAVVVAGDSAYPQIADPTAPFIYARIMGTDLGEELGYSESALDLWADRAKAWSKGTAPKNLKYIGVQKPGAPRDVYLYVISGSKERNPAAAMALIERTR